MNRHTFATLILTSSVCLFLTATTGVTAASPSPSPKASPSPSPSASPRITTSPSPVTTASESADGPTTQKLRERIERVIEEKRDQVKGVLSELSNQRRGFVAEVQRVTGESITIKSNRTTYIIPVDDNLVLLKKGQPLTVDGLAVGDWVIAIGNTDDNTFKPERLVVSATPLKPVAKTVTLGTLKTINKARTELEFQRQADDTIEKITLTKTTKFEDADANPLTVKDLQPASSILIITTGEQSALKATRIRVLGTPARASQP